MCATQKLFSPAGGVDLRAAALEEASLLLKLAERALPYANAPLVQAAAATALYLGQCSTHYLLLTASNLLPTTY